MVEINIGIQAKAVEVTPCPEYPDAPHSAIAYMLVRGHLRPTGSAGMGMVEPCGDLADGYRVFGIDTAKGEDRQFLMRCMLEAAISQALHKAPEIIPVTVRSIQERIRAGEWGHFEEETLDAGLALNDFRWLAEEVLAAKLDRMQKMIAEGLRELADAVTQPDLIARHANANRVRELADSLEALAYQKPEQSAAEPEPAEPNPITDPADSGAEVDTASEPASSAP